MRVVEYKQADAFGEATQRFLGNMESANHLLLGIDGDPCGAANEDRYVSVQGDNGVMGAGFWKPPWPLVLSMMPSEVAKWLGAELKNGGWKLRGVNAPAEVAEHFAAAFGGPSTPVRSSGIWELREFSSLLSPSRGHLGIALPKYMPLLVEWYDAYRKEIGMADRGDEQVWLRTKVAGEQVYIWFLGDAPRSMVVWNKSLSKGASIGPVFTPSEHRGKGYGRGGVAELSRRIMKAGKEYVCLYADNASPSAVAMYTNIGFEKVVDTTELRFE